MAAIKTRRYQVIPATRLNKNTSHLRIFDSRIAALMIWPKRPLKQELDGLALNASAHTRQTSRIALINASVCPPLDR